jgi:hypothetical protein
MTNQNTLNETMLFILDKQDFILESKKTSDGDYMLEGIAAVFGKENNNHRIYHEDEYLPHLDYLKEKIAQNRLLGELDHPEKFDVSLKNISHIITGLDYDKSGRILKIKVKLLDTPAGQIAKKLVDAGVPLSISSRAAGSVGNDKRVQIKKIFTYDLVADPGFENAQLKRVYESVGFGEEFYDTYQRKDITNTLECLNSSFGIENESATKIYKVENIEEFQKIINKDKNKKSLMENNEFVTAEDLNKYSVLLKKEMDSMKSTISSLKGERESVMESDNGHGTSELEARIAKLEKYSEYLAENLDNAIKYGEYVAENLDQSINYSKYLAENLDKSISYSKYLAENVDKGISYTEYVAENVDKGIEYSKYLAEKLDQNIQYSEYLAENVDRSIQYSEYLGENLDKSIVYSEYLAESLDKGIAYTEYVAEKVNDNIDYSEYLAENLNKSIDYSDYLAENLNKNFEESEYLAEKLNKSIAYSEYVAESVSGRGKQKHLRESAEFSATSDLRESGFAGNYEDLSTKIDSLIESVQTKKTEASIEAAARKLASEAKAQTQKAETLNESRSTSTTGLKFIDEMPEEYAPIWESLGEGHKQSIIAQSNFYKLDTPYQIKNFWSTRPLGSKPVGLQKLEESENISESNGVGYSNDYMNHIASMLEQKFQVKK